MITTEQEKWLAHLDDTNRTKIFPFDPASCKKFESVKTIIRDALGQQTEVVLKGASSLGISGQGELDVYIPVSSSDFERILPLLEKVFGPPRSHYPLERVRFVTSADETKVEVFVINKAGKGWMDSCRFEEYLKTHPQALEAYKVLKEKSAGLSTREYYRKKTEFINEILAQS